MPNLGHHDRDFPAEREEGADVRAAQAVRRESVRERWDVGRDAQLGRALEGLGEVEPDASPVARGARSLSRRTKSSKRRECQSACPLTDWMPWRESLDT
jgi:hypothetical protein